MFSSLVVLSLYFDHTIFLLNKVTFGPAKPDSIQLDIKQDRKVKPQPNILVTLLGTS